MTRVSLSSVSSEVRWGARPVSCCGSSPSGCSDRSGGIGRVAPASPPSGGSRRVASSSSPRGPVLRRSSGRSSGLSLISPPFICDTFGFYPVEARKAHLSHLLAPGGGRESARSLDEGCGLGCSLYIRPRIGGDGGAWLVRRAISNRLARSYHGRCVVLIPRQPGIRKASAGGGTLGHGEQAERVAAGQGRQRQVHPAVVHRHSGVSQELRHHGRCA